MDSWGGKKIMMLFILGLFIGYLIGIFIMCLLLMNKEEKEICICAAVKCTDDSIIRCYRHSYGIDVINKMKGKKLLKKPEGQGFVTSKNRFVDRFEGMKLQRASGIPSILGKYRGCVLFSEDLY